MPDSPAPRSLRAVSLIRNIPDFPQPGIQFKDITPVLADAEALREIVGALAEAIRPLKPDHIVGIESRGFIFGVPVAIELGIGFSPIRKPGKLPYERRQQEYTLEYGTNTIEIHTDAVHPGQRVVIVDDLLATGGTAQAAGKLVEEIGGTVAGFAFVVELTFLNGREKLQGYETVALIEF
jgi:adenine phosphoribosyltransferase